MSLLAWRTVARPLALARLRGGVSLFYRRSLSSRAGSATLPVIDIAPFLRCHGHRADSLASTVGNRRAADRVVEEVLAASSTWGFFFVTGHGIPKEHFSSVFNEAANFFEQPNSLKKSLHINNHEGFRGYTGIFEQGNYDTDETDPRAALMDSTENTGDSSGGVGEGAGPGNSLMDHKQVYHIGQELSREHPCYDATLFAPNVYPKADAGVPGFEVALRAHWGECMALSDDMFRIFAACLGLPLSHFEPLCDKGMNSMNTIHYPPLHPDATPDQPGIGAHTDFECFTLLAQREGAPSALEVLSPLTGEWERVAFPTTLASDALVVNVGDMMARWSNDRLRSTVHRAAVDATRDRHSIAFFRCCNYDTLVRNLTEEPDKYPPVLAGVHMLKRIGAANVNT